MYKKKKKTKFLVFRVLLKNDIGLPVNFKNTVSSERCVFFAQCVLLDERRENVCEIFPSDQTPVET